MADGKTVKTNDSVNENRQEIKELVKSGKAFTFMGSAISRTKAYKDEVSGEYYVEAVSSSDQEDLVGDMFTSKALGIMKSDFIGKTAFMNHRTNVPDDVFGSVVLTDLTKEDGKQLFVLKFVVEQENEPAMKTWRMLNAGRVQLGTSVTVLVKSCQPNPNRKGGIIIDDIEVIEVSIVGVPCNRESKTMTATATKALEIANLSSEADETIMETPEVPVEKTAPANAEPSAENAAEPNTATDDGAEQEAPAGEATESDAGAAAPEASATTVEAKTFFPRTVAAMALFKSRVAEVTASKTAKTGAELPAINAKGMFADRVEHPKLWDLLDILWDVYYECVYRIWNMEYAGETDFSEPIAEWELCLDEFKAAATDSFIFWKIPQTVEAISLSLEEAGEIEQTIKTLAGVIETADAKDADAYRGTAKSLLELAEKAGIPFVPTNSDATNSEAVDVTKSAEYIEMATRAETAETAVKNLTDKLSATEEDLEITKAGLKAAVEATNALLRQPLHAQAGSN